MTNTSPQERKEVDAWITENGYADIGEWMADSDYLLIKDAYWVDLDDNIVDPYTQAYFAMEAFPPRTFTLDAEAYDELLAMLDRDPEPSPKLVELLQRPTVFDYKENA